MYILFHHSLWTCHRKSKIHAKKECITRDVPNNLRVTVEYIVHIYCGVKLAYIVYFGVVEITGEYNLILNNESIRDTQSLPAVFKRGYKLSETSSSPNCDSRPTQCIVRDNFKCAERKHST